MNSNKLDILRTNSMKRFYGKNKNLPFMCYLFSRVPEFTEKRNLQPGSSEFSVVNSWPWRVYQQKLYRHKIRDVDNLKRVLLHRRERRARAEKSGDAVYDIYTVDIDRQSKV